MKKIKAVLLIFTLTVVALFPGLAVSAEETEKMLTVNLSGLELETEFEESKSYYIYKNDEHSEVIDIYDKITNSKVATFELNYAPAPTGMITPLSTIQSTGAYSKYLASGLTIVHSFGFSHTGTGKNKKVVAVVWNSTSANGWSFFKKIDGTQSAAKVDNSRITGSYNVVIQAEINGSLTVEMEKTLKLLGFSGSIKVGSSYYGTKSFHGSWTLNINHDGSTPPCQLQGNIWVCPMSLPVSYQ